MAAILVALYEKGQENNRNLNLDIPENWSDWGIYTKTHKNNKPAIMWPLDFLLCNLKNFYSIKPL